MKQSVLDAPVRKNLIFVLPGLLLYSAFVLGPILAAIYLSFTEWNGIARPDFIGFSNYLSLLTDSNFVTALKNNALLMVFYCLLPLFIGMAFASIVRSLKGREQMAIRTLLFMPYIMPSAVLGIVWHWLYNPAFGPINQILKSVGLGAIALPWLGDFNFALPSVGMVATWYYCGFCMVIFLTGLQRLDPSIFEAARADGAGAAYTFRRITLPLLLPEIRIVLLLTIIASIKSFDLIFTMTRGGPANSTLVPNIYMYQLGFQLNRYGYAAAVAIVGAILIFTVNYIVHRFVRPADGGSR
ncbi:carbohydrate ABC transporter permease [Consotaella salsifontis]|uniref:Carbohydrate ABC transporter membrane protein 1, CUT1 family n=1 Tax=Consotaella salsifontis TaxID=1365950 RepID=A0A1T4RA59_9HYPH|nr:sugar ABC transporter permease [Consotaella salsifontis]SKA12799.1 carbohydrate ABC transporter membrane protein 1, CUT1 family [Consotaella salsifontis]